MRKTVLVYGLLGGVLIAALKMVEYRYLVVEHSLEIYGGIVALIFASLGIWLGLKLTRTREVVREVQVPVEVKVTGPFERNEKSLEQLGITPRELEILEPLPVALVVVALVSAGVLSRRKKNGVADGGLAANATV